MKETEETFSLEKCYKDISEIISSIVIKEH